MIHSSKQTKVMKNFFLTKIRLSWFFILFFVIYVVLAFQLPLLKFEGGTLTLFSVNSFLYGFYISPILGAQKGRIEELHKIIRAESNAIFTMMLETKKLPEAVRNEVQELFKIYMHKTMKDYRKSGEVAYEKLIGFCLDYKGKDKEEVAKLLEKLVANQANRTNLHMQMANKVYSNEWMIMFLLFSITLSFIILIDTGPDWVFRVIAALLSTGLSMLILILVKLSTLTHKKARQMWDPFHALLDSNFYRID